MIVLNRGTRGAHCLLRRPILEVWRAIRPVFLIFDLNLKQSARVVELILRPWGLGSYRWHPKNWFSLDPASENQKT